MVVLTASTTDEHITASPNGCSGLEINISSQWTIGPLALEIWWSCQISGGPDLANCTFVLIKSNTADRIQLLR